MKKTALTELIDWMIENRENHDCELSFPNEYEIIEKAKTLLSQEQNDLMEAYIEGHRYYGINEDDKVLKLAYKYFYQKFDNDDL